MAPGPGISVKSSELKQERKGLLLIPSLCTVCVCVCWDARSTMAWWLTVAQLVCFDHSCKISKKMIHQSPVMGF